MGGQNYPSNDAGDYEGVDVGYTEGGEEGGEWVRVRGMQGQEDDFAKRHFRAGDGNSANTGEDG